MNDVADKGAVASIIERQRREKKDKLFVKIDPNNCNRVIIGGVIALKVQMGDKIIILEDEFKSSYDCKTCDGSGTVLKLCLMCDGGKLHTQLSPCGRCSGLGSWKIECKDCNGKGALLEIPDQAKARPTSGKIVAMGPEVGEWWIDFWSFKFFKKSNSLLVGDRVAYSGYTGHLLPFKGNTRLRIMAENEFFCWVEDVEGGTQEGEKIEFVDKDTAYDLT